MEPHEMTDQDRERLRDCKRRGMDVLYAQGNSYGYECWTWSEGDRVKLPFFHTLEGLQSYAKRRRFGIVYL